MKIQHNLGRFLTYHLSRRRNCLPLGSIFKLKERCMDCLNIKKQHLQKKRSPCSFEYNTSCILLGIRFLKNEAGLQSEPKEHFRLQSGLLKKLPSSGAG